MVTNIPPSLRSEKDLKEYFEYYLSRPLVKSTMGVTSAVQPGFIDRSLAFVFNKTRLLASRLHKWYGDSGITHSAAPEESHGDNKPNTCEAPLIERVVLVRKMSDLASLLEKREEVLKNLETAHIKLARNALKAVSEALGPKSKTERLRSAANSLTFGQLASTFPTGSLDLEAGTDDGADEGEDRLHLLVRTLAPYVEDLRSTGHDSHAHSRWPRWLRADKASFPCTSSTQKARAKPEKTVWEALLSLPRSTLDAYQPLIHLSALFRGKTVPSIDYYTAKLNLLTALITEKRAQSTASYPAMPTAFLTFADPADARRACKYLAVHPNNPVNVCLVTMAPSYEDLDWTRLMKSTFRVEFVKDWVVNMGVWGFTIFWVFPVTSIVGLVSIQNISNFWPGLVCVSLQWTSIVANGRYIQKNYLDRHEFQSEVLQSLVPTLLVSGLALLVPLILRKL
ncbi:hypothetical protein PHLCEN_2v13652 [Hermanssonia centrifuga]|uniref:CSC1/OSCA1-like cytosolic domain-containing protein n=1 Tax=Hermanssonia centrifuga TaxID=98765 RepID=A0A2R6NDU6_9APHY|nr:hypothetical protein PHLCEN_2v13652 [Hermanssonia centrifuga]